MSIPEEYTVTGKPDYEGAKRGKKAPLFSSSFSVRKKMPLPIRTSEPER